MAMNPSVLDKKCFSCSSGDIYVDYRAGDVTCLECGVIQSDRLIDQGNEQRFYEDDEGKKLSRTSGFGDSLGMYNTMFVRGSERDRTILERAQRTAINRKENAILGHLPMVNEMCTQLNLSSSIKAKACELFQTTCLQNIVQSSFPRLLDEIVLAYEVPQGVLSRYQALIARHLHLAVGRITAIDLVNRMCKRLGFSHLEVEYAYHMSRRVVELEVLESLPPQAVVGVIIVTTKILTQITSQSAVTLTKLEASGLAQGCFVSFESVSSMFKVLRPALGVLTPDDLQGAVQSALLPRGLDELAGKLKKRSSEGESLGSSSEGKVSRMKV